MEEISHKSSHHDLIPNQLHLYSDDGNGYCDYWVMSIINNHFIKCPAWERQGKPMTFSEIENDTIQYERVSLSQGEIL